MSGGEWLRIESPAQLFVHSGRCIRIDLHLFYVDRMGMVQYQTLYHTVELSIASPTRLQQHSCTLVCPYVYPGVIKRPLSYWRLELVLDNPP